MVKIRKVKKGNVKPVTPFKTLEEEARFWDTHSVVDEINKNTLVGFHQANKTETITIRFDPRYLQALRRQAAQRGVGPTTLARMWVMEKLSQGLS